MAADALDGGTTDKPSLDGLEAEVDFGGHPETFVRRPVVDYVPAAHGLSRAVEGVAYRVHFDYGDGGAAEFVKRLVRLGEDEHAAQLEALVIGAWGSEDMCTGEGGQPVVDAIVALKDRCPRLEAIFLGDVVQEECEVSWLQLPDWSPILKAFPKLEHFRVRGQASANSFSSDTLRSLVVQSMTNRQTAQSIGAANLPELEHLELWLGTDEYGGDTRVEDLLPILSGKQFPKLRYLGLRNAEFANDVADAVASAPILERIKILDMSDGVMDDRGGNALLASPAAAKLERLDLHYNFFSPEVAQKLQALGPKVDTERGDATDCDDDGEDYRFVAVGE